ncbi:hypothetical protein SmJEL517_g05545 [Synchytrium microbalum]|uniref:Uncharacterized protein n=1 Tax=Synchytrium microbalum TaxID=1806994 RepID=A0A507C0G9_9FUNG|nr:uncharacterized protein SmJEL517_g05545 [Synchytrium microbalum]TPX31033.1 hypothetical protein SmJEL517_g05545 [Synchytrium microbalum]
MSQDNKEETALPPSSADEKMNKLRQLPKTIEEYLANSRATDPANIEKNNAPARVYLEDSVLPLLIEGLKALNRERPPNPSEWLGMYLVRNSRAD